VTMAPVDLFTLCRALRRGKARKSPRSLRYEFTPGEPVRAVLEPWDQVIEMSGSAIWDGPKPLSIRTWGRERLRTLARLIPVCKHIDVYLAGHGLPGIYVLDLGELLFTPAPSRGNGDDWTARRAQV